MLIRWSVIAVLSLQSVSLSADDGCNVQIGEMLNQASALGATTAYEQMQLGDPPKTSDLSCIEAILEYKVDVLISIPNLGQLMSEIIDRTCNAARDAVQDASQSLQYNWNPNSISGLGGFGNIPTTDFQFNDQFATPQLKRKATKSSLEDLFK